MHIVLFVLISPAVSLSHTPPHTHTPPPPLHTHTHAHTHIHTHAHTTASCCVVRSTTHVCCSAEQRGWSTFGPGSYGPQPSFTDGLEAGHFAEFARKSAPVGAAAGVDGLSENLGIATPAERQEASKKDQNKKEVSSNPGSPHDGAGGGTINHSEGIANTAQKSAAWTTSPSWERTGWGEYGRKCYNEDL